MKTLLFLLYFFIVPTVYQQLGIYQYNGYVISGYVIKKTNTQQILPYKYTYEIYLISKTVVQNKLVSTKCYGIHIFVNGKNVTEVTNPFGLNFVIDPTGTKIYSWQTNNPTPRFNIEWKKLSY